MKPFFSIILISLILSPNLFAQTDDELLDSLQHSAFRFFWYEANPLNGLIKDRNTSGSPSSIASVGFGLTAICIGVDRGWVTREAARERVLTTLKTFWQKPQGAAASGTIGYKGFFYHFLDMTTATRTWNSELSSIDTGLLLAGILDAQQYFTGTDSIETLIRAYADSIYRRVDWNWMRNFNPGIMMEWKPETGFGTLGYWIGYNESMILYILALGSPTKPVPTTAWQAWTSGYTWETYYGFSYVPFAPLFGHQYSHCWVDFRNIRDAYMRWRGIDYFENSRRATLAQRAYCIANPGNFVGYSDSVWGLTASDGPTGYAARGAPPAFNDDGTITPTAALSSIPFTPEQSLAVAHKLYKSYHRQLWTNYGFRDAFNPTVNWWGPDVIGIDQGPIIIMIENYRTQSVWNRFMKSPYIQLGLQRAGFEPVTNVNEPSTSISEFKLHQNYPNPFNPVTTIQFEIPNAADVTLKVYDLFGREVAILTNGFRTAGKHNIEFRTSIPESRFELASGIYFYQLVVNSNEPSRSGIFVQTKKLLLMK